MKPSIHRLAALLATTCIATFFCATVLVELFGSIAAVQQVKALIVFPGLFILIPAIATAGATGAAMAKRRKGRLVEAKQKRMPFIAANGLLILIPCAYFLDQWASAGQFDSTFYALQALELLAGATNLTLMSMNLFAGRQLVKKGRRKSA
ncbi:hypothetical protein [uncultured Ferrimonas sp.]|uniref:hypothetical protein n=1 Tax=uncultured Ferrimonas sp. TaxID=432640 RepID=UPI002623F292|nr:hypothetical protein [uncultured Ferrimonas sp.]